MFAVKSKCPKCHKPTFRHCDKSPYCKWRMCYQCGFENPILGTKAALIFDINNGRYFLGVKL